MLRPSRRRPLASLAVYKTQKRRQPARQVGSIGPGEDRLTSWHMLTTDRAMRPLLIYPSEALSAHLHGWMRLVHGSAHQQQPNIQVQTRHVHASVAGLQQLFSERNLPPLAIGMSLMLFQQITGQPSVLYYAAKIFKDAGFASDADATKVSAVLGFFKLLATGK